MGRVPAQVGPRTFEQAHEHVQELEIFRRAAAAGRDCRASGLGDLLFAEDALATASLGLRARHRERHRVVAHEVPLVHVEHRLKLRVSLPVEQGEGVDVASVGLAHEGSDGRGSREHCLYFACAGRELCFSKRFDVFGIGGHDGQCVRASIEDHGA